MIRLNTVNINDPAHFDERFTGELVYSDIERFEMLASRFKGGSYVDIGVFDSPMPHILSERYPDAEIHALDFAPKLVAMMQKKYPKAGYQLIEDSMHLPFADNSIDYVVAGEIMEHMEDPKAFVAECERIVKPGGWLAVSTPHEEYVKADRIGGPFHLWSFDEEDIKTLFPDAEYLALREQVCLTWVVWKQKK